MKRSIAVLILAVLIYLFCGPVTARKSTVSDFGIKIGVNYSRLNVDDPNWHYNEDLMLGAYYSINALWGIYIQPEVLYTRKGIENSDGTKGYHFDYVEIPISAKIFIPLYSKAAMYIYTGPAVAFLWDVEYSLGEKGEQHDIHLMNSTTKNDVSLILGSGLRIKSGEGSVLFDFRYTRGYTHLEDIRNGDADDYISGARAGDKLLNRTITLSIGYEF